MSRIVAIDFGQKRTGIAATDPLKIIASPLATVPTTEIFNFLIKYCADEQVETFVVGLPLHPDGNPAQIADEVNRFVENLKKKFPKTPIERQDERNTSNDARKIMLQSGIGQKKRREKERVDRIAAALILEQFMFEKGFWT